MKLPSAYDQDPQTWMETVRPIVMKCELAAKLNQAVTFKGEGVHAVGELLQRMAKLLDAHVSCNFKEENDHESV